jgi:hypothetical protein
VKDPVEIQLPAGNLLFIVLRVEESRDRISSTLLDNLRLYLGNGSAISLQISWPIEAWIVASAHIVKFWIALSTV